MMGRGRERGGGGSARLSRNTISHPSLSQRGMLTNLPSVPPSLLHPCLFSRFFFLPSFSPPAHGRRRNSWRQVDRSAGGGVKDADSAGGGTEGGGRGGRKPTWRYRCPDGGTARLMPRPRRAPPSLTREVRGQRQGGIDQSFRAIYPARHRRNEEEEAAGGGFATPSAFFHNVFP